MLSAINRFFEENRWAGDAIIAGIALVVLLAIAANQIVTGQQAIAVGAYTFLLVVPLFVRRTWPQILLVAVVAICLVQVIIVDYPVPGDLVIPLAIHAAAAYIPDRRWGYGALAAGVVGAGVAAVRWTFQAEYGYAYASRFDVGQMMFLFLAGVAAVGVAYLLGVRHRERREHADEQLAALAERNRLLAADRDTRAEMSAAAERARIARELHDIVAHSLSVIVVQADGGAAAAKTKPEMAPQVLETIAGTSRDALAQMRRMVSVLRAGPSRYDDGPDYAPAPGPGDIGALVEQVRAAGLPVTLDIIGSRREMTDDAGLAVYRCVQESLTNVLKHAGPEANCRIVLHYGAAEVVVTVSDDGRGAATDGDRYDAIPGGHGLGDHSPSDYSPNERSQDKRSRPECSPGSDTTGQDQLGEDLLAGHGLVGMRERVGLQGGTVHAGPKAEGGFEVTATVPYGVSK